MTGLVSSLRSHASSPSASLVWVLPVLALVTVFIPTTSSASQATEVDALFRAWNSQKTPGCAVQVKRGDDTVLDRSYGSADLEHGAAINANTVFEAGSVSKQFTAAAVLLLVERGQLSLDDDVRKYIPELPDYGTVLRIRHLLTHTSGLRDWSSIAELAGEARGTHEYHMDDILGMIVRQRTLNFIPGAEYSYSNSGYNLLAIVVDRISGQTLQEFTDSNIFKPLGMKSTSWRENFRRIVPNRAIAYARSPNEYAQEMPFENSIGNGGLLTTTGDLGRWANALMNNGVGQHVARDMLTQSPLNDGTQISYRMGIWSLSYRGEPEISHSGNTAGYKAWIALYPRKQLTVALLCNAFDVDAPTVGRAVADVYLQKRPLPLQAALPRVDGLAGLYLDSHDQPLRVTIVGKALHVSGKTLTPKGGGHFQYSVTSEISFEAPGRAVLISTDGNTVFRKQPNFDSATNAEGYEGEYGSDEVGAVYLISRSANGIKLSIERHPTINQLFEQVGSDLFAAPTGIIRFKRDKKGKTESFSISVSRANQVLFTRRRDISKVE